MTTIISMIVGFVLGVFATVIVMVVIADRDDNEP